MRVHLGVVAGVAVGLALATACSTGPGPGTAAAGAAGGSADLTALQTKINSYTAVPAWSAPGPPLDATKLKGKTIFNIPDSSGNPFASGIAQSEATVAGQLGLNYINCTNQGQVTEWVSCYNQAVQRKVDVINDFGGVDPRQLGPQIAAAQSAGIQVVAHNVYGFSQNPLGLKYSVPTPYETAGQLLGDWVAMDTKRNADVLVVVSNEVLATQPIIDGMKAVFAKECQGCGMTIVNVPVKDWSTKIQSEVQSALVRDPKLNYVVPIYDSMSQFVVPAITAGGKIGTVHVATFDGTPFVLKYIQDGDIVRMDIGENLDWIGYAFLDSDLRLLSGQQLPTIFNAKTPLRIFTKSNVNETGTPPSWTGGYGNTYASSYKKLWGVS
jgi:ribose transport system substrate-binding protein